MDEFADVLGESLNPTAEGIDVIEEVLGNFPAEELSVDFYHPSGEVWIERGDEESVVEEGCGNGKVLGWLGYYGVIGNDQICEL